ncbi:radical SAM protein [Brevibacillus fortis]|uniref:radical SAM protein n=1 Tax=Brevibacillus fortis TaxID=2126352 RepID=UPI0011B1CCE1|nr:radical SAM protein [Brevibacillus fortis]
MDPAINTRAPLRAPFAVCLWLTDYCNLACKYCYAMPFQGKRIDTGRVLELIDELIELGVFDLTLAGGEPLLHPDVMDIIHHSVKGGLRVGVLTNGTMVNQKFCEELEELVSEKNFILQVSLDSIDPTINDVSRGRTEEVVRNIRALKGTKMQVQLSCVVHKLNAATAHLLIEEFYPDIKRFHFLNIQRTVQALKHPELLLDEEDAFQFWMNLNEYSRQFPPDLFLPSLRIQMRSRGSAHVEPEFSLSDEAGFECSSCSAGWTHLNITTDFDVLGCDIAKDYIRMGNVRHRSFYDVWHSPEAHAVRNAPFPACYRIKGPTGERLEDWLKVEYKHAVGTSEREQG